MRRIASDAVPSDVRERRRVIMSLDRFARVGYTDGQVNWLRHWFWMIVRFSVDHGRCVFLSRRSWEALTGCAVWGYVCDVI